MKKIGTMLKPRHMASLAYKVGLLSLVLAVALQSTSITVLAATSPTFSTPGAANYSVLSGAAVTNSGPTTISGNVGISPGIGALPHYTGFASVTFGVGSAVHDADPSAAAAQADNTAAFTALDQPCTTTYAGTKDLATLNLVPGVYCADAFRLSGTLTLSGSGVWIFKSASDLITSSGVGASVVGGDPCNVWWRVVSSATLGVGTHFIGNILASTAITLQTNASLNGRAMTQTAAVTMDSNSISGPVCAGVPPTFTTTASGPVSAGGTITDTAHLVGGAGVLGGSISFNVFLPGDTTCAAPTAVGAPVPVTGIGDYTSATFTTGAVGTYRWQATYDDGVNPAVTSACNEAGESSEVNALFTPLLTSTASGPVTVGNNITDTAHFTGGSTVPPPTGTISLNVYLPGDILCATPIAVGPARTLTGAGVGDYTSAAYNTTVAGSFRWRAFYSGDANNNPASTACNAANETSIVNRATPTFTTTASTPVTVGANISDTATLGGGYGALSGTILFFVYAPGDPGCTTPIPVLPAKTVTGAGNYISGPYTTTIVGSYLWQAIYSGDPKNEPVTTPCGDAGETSVVNAVGGKGGGGGGTTPSTLPGTGFEPGVVTRLPKQSVDQTYSRLGDLWLEIPRLGVQMPIVGVPPTEKSWDVSWLSDQAGWLQGTAFPTWSGNSVLTGHVYDANGNEGPFVHLDTLWYGDQVYIHAWGQLFIYEVRSRLTLSPNSVSTAIRHEDYPWVTLVTCQGYNERTNSYLYRTVIKAVLMKVN